MCVNMNMNRLPWRPGSPHPPTSYPAVELAYNQSPEIWEKNAGDFTFSSFSVNQTNLRLTRLWAQVYPQLANSLRGGGVSPADLQAAESSC